MENEKIVINLKGGKIAVLSVQAFDGDIDVDNVLKIDYSNLLGEILTFPVVFNRIANMKAEVANIMAEEKLRCDIAEAELYKTHQGLLAANSDKSRGPSIKEVEMAVLRDPKLETIKKAYYQRVRDFDYLDSLYWSAQSKDKKLNVLSERITPEEFEKELVEGTINGVMIQMQKKAIPDLPKSGGRKSK